MAITKEDLLNERKSLEEQRDRAQALIQQATGAIHMIDFMLSKLNEESAEVKDETR